MTNVMKWLQNEWLALLGIAIVAMVMCFDLFSHVGTPATMDARIHITTIDQFYRVLQSGEFPVTWLSNFANYGEPVPLYAQQLPAYLGAAVTFLTHNPVTTFNILILLSIFFSGVLYYLFVRFYCNRMIAFNATIFLILAPYRIIDIYIRGDLPELMASIFLPLILISLYILLIKKDMKGFYFLLFSYTFLALVHPMMLVIYSFFVFPYALFLMLALKQTRQQKIRFVIFIILAVLIGVGIAFYYLLPLAVETKYLYYGQTNPFSKLFLGWQNIFWESWPTHIDGGVVTRVQQVQTGIIETLIIILGILITIKDFILEKKKKFSLVTLCVLCVVVLLFFLLPYSFPVFTHTILHDIQFPWRMLAVFIFIPPLILALLLNNVKQKNLSVTLCMVALLALFILRLPQLYGKDYVSHPLSSYDFTTENLNSVIMNTVWTGETQTYPVEKNKSAIIAGKGEILQSIVHNASRTYLVIAHTPMQMVDYTFYFPGWTVKVDGQTVPIEYQDPHYRGVITYAVPPGKHTILVVYTLTKVRQVAYVITFVCLGVSVILLLLRKKMKKIIFLTT